MTQPQWLEWAQKLQAIAQIGLTYAKDDFDIERYEQIREIAAEIAAQHTDIDINIIRTLFSHDKGYTTPKLDVRGVVFQNNQILLVKEAMDGLWTLPGGWADVGDTPAEAVVREIREEAGYETRAIKLLGCYDRQRHDHPPYEFYAYKLYFLCELTGEQIEHGHETLAVDWFDEDGIPPLSTGRVTETFIKRMFEHYRHPDWPTDFD